MASLLPHAALLPLLILILAVLILIVGRFLALRGCRGESEARTHLPLPLPLPEPAGAGVVVEEELEEGGRERGRRRRRRKARRKGEGEGDEALQQPPRFPLASVAGSLRRRITARYDDLARATHARCLTIDQVHEFINCLVDARNELLHKSETVQRSCRVKKALLSNPCSRRANSYERLCEQVHKLEAEHKRLKKDADIYNYIQEQLQMSHSYKLLTELSAMMERADREEALAAEATEMTFEELLALEKSDAAFWQRHRKLTSISSK